MAAPFDKSGIIEFFLVEAGEHIQNLNKGLLSLEKDPSDGAMIDELFRAAHTLKGSAAMMGFQGISDVAHTAEDMLGQFRSGSLPIRKDTLNFLFDSVDAAKLMVDGVASGKPEDALVVSSITQSYKDIIDKIRSASAGPLPSEQTAARIAEKAATVSPQATASSVPAPVSAQPGPRHKDELDRAWEETFGVNSEEPILVEPLPEEPPTRETPEPPAMSTAPVAEKPHKEKAAPLVSPPVETPVPVLQAAVEQAVVPPGQESPVAPVAPSLKEELDEAKKTGVHEKRGVGRRASDAADIEKQFIRVNIERLDNLMNLVGEMIVNRNRLARQVDFIKTLREELAFSQGRLLHEIKQFEEKYEYTLNYGVPGSQVAEPSSDFMELEFDRYDDFNLLSRKLTEITNDTNEIMMELAGFFDSFELDTTRIATITTNLQDEITMARMVEVDRLYQMFQRPVRDLAQDENKQVNLVVSGGETKIDKTIFEIISDPLMHMIRNAISHGIEGVDERKRLGKDPVGALILKARHEGNSIILEIEDDGCGMDPAALRKTATDKGFMSSAEAQGLTDLDALNLIFRPGFSTAKTVGKVSGRGVGMDVVSNQLSKINGRIEIRTEKGVGTKFLIRLPLTLAIA